MRTHQCVVLVSSLILVGLRPGLATAGWANITPTGLNTAPGRMGFGYSSTGAKRVYVGSRGGGLFFTDNSGSPWTQVYDDFVSEGSPTTFVIDAMFDPGDAAHGVAITLSGSYYSLSNGASWVRHPANEVGDSPGVGYGMALIPDGSGLVATDARVGSVGGAVWKYNWSTQEWVVANPGMLIALDSYFAVDFDQSNPPVAYVGSQLRKIIWSDDMFQTLHAYGASLPAGVGAVKVITCDPELASRVLIGHGNNLYRSTDRSQPWQLVWTAPSEVTALIHDPAVPTRMYLGTKGNGVYRSLDRGTTWTPMTQSGLGYLYIIDLGIHPENSTRVYASSANAEYSAGGVFRIDIGGGGHEPPPEELAARPTEGTDSRDLALRSAGEVLWVRLGVAAEVKLEVFDPSGRRIRTMPLGAMPNGEHRVSWDSLDDGGRRVSPGVYLYRAVTSRGEQATAKVVVLRKQ